MTKSLVYFVLSNSCNRRTDLIKIFLLKFFSYSFETVGCSIKEKALIGNKIININKKDKNYLKLKNGEVGGNLIYKYKSKCLIESGLEWIDYFEQQISKTVIDKQTNINSAKIIKSELSEIANFCRLKINALLNANIETKPVEGIFNYDILKWIDDEKANKRLSDYKFSSDSEKLIFEFTKDQKTIRKDIFKRYGTSVNAISKIVTRISNLESQFRKVRYENDNYLRDIYKNIGENFVKYSLSN